MGLTRITAAQISNIDYKQAVRAVTVSNVTLVAGAPNSVDGVNLAISDRVLVTGQSDSKQNGIYLVSILGSGSNGTWIRSDDTNATGEIEAGMIVMVTEGAVYADTQWVLTTNDPIVVGTTALVFEQNNSRLASGNSNVIVSTNGNVSMNVRGTSNVLVISNVGVTVDGNTTLDGNLSVTGNVTVIGNLNYQDVTDLVVGDPLIYIGANNTSDIVDLGMVASANVAGTYQYLGLVRDASDATWKLFGNVTTLPVTTVDFTNAIYQPLQSGAITSTGAISATGNITGNYLFGNGSQLTGVATDGISMTSQANTPPASPNNGDFWYNTYSDIKYQYIQTGTSNVWVDQSFPTSFATILFNNVTNSGSNATGNIGNSTGWYGNIYVAAVNADTVSASGNISAANVNAAALSLSGNVISALNVTGNVSGGNITTSGLVSAAGNVSGSNINASGSVSAAGNVTGGNLMTSGALSVASVIGNLIPSANVTYNLGSPSVRWKDIYLSNSSIYLGNVTLSADDTGLTVNGSNVVTAAPGNAISTTGNVTGANVTTGGLVSAVGNVIGGNLTTAALVQGATVSATGNVVGGNIISSGQISSSGNVTGLNLFGTLQTSSQLNITQIGQLSSLVATGNVSGGNINTAGIVSAAGQITAIGNVTAGNLVTAGSLSINSGNSSGTVLVNAGGNGVGNIGSATGYFNTAHVKATSAQYADLAEMYLADQHYDPGTVLEFGGIEEVHQTYASHSTKIAGVVSTQPSYIMNSGLQGQWPTAVALTGRVPCQVLGPVSKGDVLVSSNIPGVAQRLTDRCWAPGCVIGKALESITNSGVETIEVVVGRF